MVRFAIDQFDPHFADSEHNLADDKQVDFQPGEYEFDLFHARHREFYEAPTQPTGPAQWCHALPAVRVSESL